MSVPDHEVRRVGLMGPFGYGNLGDAAIVDAMIAAIHRVRPGWRLRAYTLDPSDTELRHAIVSHPLSRQVPGDDGTGPWARLLGRLRSSPRPLVRRLERVAGRGPAELGMLVRAYRSLGGVDALVVCGSGQIQDMWGGGGPWSSPYTMLRWAALARLRGARFMVVSVGAGPVDSWTSRRFYRWALSLACYRSFRDEWSRRFVAEQIGFDRGDPVEPDLAFGLDVSGVEPAVRPPDDVGPAGSGRVVGVGPIGYHRAGNWPTVGPDRYARYLDTIVTFIVTLLARGDRIRLLVGEAHYDRLVVDDVIAELDLRRVDRSQVDDGRIETVPQLLGAIAGCDAVVVSRFHNVLLAYLLGRPAVALSYQAKTASLMATFDQEELCLPIEAADVDELLRCLEAALDQPAFPARAAAVVELRRKELEEQHEHLASLV